MPYAFLVSLVFFLAYAQPSLAEPVIAPLESEGLDNETCLACHGDPSADHPIDSAKYGASIHSGSRCTSCHTDVSEIPHAVPLKPVSCSQCHHIETEIYLQSDHGIALHSGVSEAASCRDCHGNPHELLNSRNPNSQVFRANIPATCARCHGQIKEMAKFHLNQSAPVSSYTESVHGIALTQKAIASSAVCTDCHGSHDLHRATNLSSKLYWQNIPSTCGKCHENIKQTYQRSVHGAAVKAGKRDAPVCTDCHGEHSITAVKEATSKVFPSHIPETCGQCHAAERVITKYQLPAHVLETYMESFHGLSLQLGSV
ncbi:MAG: hypothetical protein HYT88_07460, partial [Candidatus Omnitrophica bacterium]|nr:hypothetical protein [Candidatus Omnitrophota bacterium]